MLGQKKSSMNSFNGYRAYFFRFYNLMTKMLTQMNTSCSKNTVRKTVAPSLVYRTQLDISRLDIVICTKGLPSEKDNRLVETGEFSDMNPRERHGVTKSETLGANGAALEVLDLLSDTPSRPCHFNSINALKEPLKLFMLRIRQSYGAEYSSCGRFNGMLKAFGT